MAPEAGDVQWKQCGGKMTPSSMTTEYSVNRVYGFDLLRGIAALAVAIPHLILLSNFSEMWEGVSIVAVEVFFGLSGYVLAPQVLKLQSVANNYNFTVFLLRRWIRTIAPYILATAFIAILTSNLVSVEFIKKALFLDTLVNLPKDDFFSISWSLAVEEWYYVLAAVLAVSFRNHKLWIVFAGIGAVCAAIKIAGIFVDPDWVVNVRRATVYRLDAIAFGFLMYCFRDRLPVGLGKAVLTVVATIGLAFVALMFASHGAALVNKLSMLGAIYLLSAFSLACVLLFRELEPVILQARMKPVSAFLGKISYAVYLFHLPIGYALKALGLSPAVILILGAPLVILFSWLFADLIERHLIDGRPSYRDPGISKAVADDALTPGRIFMGWAGVVAGIAVCVLAIEGAAKMYLRETNPRLESSLLHTKADLNKGGTRNVFAAIDPILGYAHPKRLALDTKSYSVSQIDGFGVHRGKREDSFKIFVLGGSTSDPFLAIRKKEPPWTKYLYLNCRELRDCEVWNAGVGGFGSAQELIRLVRDVLPRKPELIVSMHGPNELNRIRRSPFTTGMQNDRAKALSRSGKIWYGNVMPNALAALAYVRRKDDTPARLQEIYYGFDYRDRSPYENWLANVEMMQAMSESQGSAYYVVLQPLVGWGEYQPDPEVLKAGKRKQTYYDNVREFYVEATAACARMDFCIDASRVFDGDSRNLYTDIRHPNDAGNKLIADFVSTQLIERGAVHEE